MFKFTAAESVFQTSPPLHPVPKPLTTAVSLKVKCSSCGSSVEEPQLSSSSSSLLLLGRVRSLSGLNAGAHSRSAPPWFPLQDHLLVQRRSAQGCSCVHINLQPLVFLFSPFFFLRVLCSPGCLCLHCMVANLQVRVLLTATAH